MSRKQLIKVITADTSVITKKVNEWLSETNINSVIDRQITTCYLPEDKSIAVTVMIVYEEGI